MGLDDHLYCEFRDWLRSSGRKRTYVNQTVLFHQGAGTDHVVLIEAGLVRVTSTAPSGHVSVLALRGPGELVGEFAALDGMPRSATCTAVEPVTAYVMTASSFRNGLLAHPQYALKLLQRTVSRIREADRWRSEFGACSAGDRVVLVLDWMARQHGRPVAGASNAIAVVASHQEIAGAAGASRDSVLRALRSLESESILYTGRGQVVITDPLLLADRAAKHRF